MKSHYVKPFQSDNQPQDYQALAASAAARGEWQAAAHFYAQALQQRTAELALIHSVQQGLSSRLEMQAIYDLLGDSLRDTFNAQVVMISQYDPLTNSIYHHYAIERGQHLRIPGWNPIDSTRLKIVQTRQPVIINLAEIIRLLEAEKMHIVPGTQLPHTWMGVPMLVGDEVKGIVSLQNLDIENAFSPSDIDLLATLTNSMSLSLENARLFNETQRLLNVLEAEMEIARRTQQSILPVQLPEHPGYGFGSLMIAARAVGGDFYDFIRLDDRHLCMVIGDVSGQGLPAALVMALTFSFIRSETGRTTSPGQLLLNVNRFLLNMNQNMDAAGMFVSLLYSILDFETGRVTYLRAGHLPPLILDQYGNFLDVGMDQGQPLGLFEDVSIDQQQFILPGGGLALLYSDGLIETIDPLGGEFGIRRVKDELLLHRSANPRKICDQLWLAVQKHSGSLPQQDDFTAVVVKRFPPGA
jgi:serine phosphatase RsbU (regulator of sigma subunit)